MEEGLCSGAVSVGTVILGVVPAPGCTTTTTTTTISKFKHHAHIQDDEVSLHSTRQSNLTTEAAIQQTFNFNRYLIIIVASREASLSVIPSSRHMSHWPVSSPGYPVYEEGVSPVPCLP